jgi:hypothetical protein
MRPPAKPRLQDTRREVEAALFADQSRETPITAELHSRRSELQQTYNKVFDQVVKVGIGFQVVRIHQVDEAAETFTLDFDMHMTWRDPSLVDVKEPDWEKAWSPMIIFRNDISAIQISKKIFVSDPSRGIVFCYLKYYATFYEILELNAFPFDRQILHIDISSFRPSRELRFQQFPGRQNRIFATPISMWDVVTTKESTDDYVGSGAGRALSSSAPPTIVTREEDLIASADGLLYPRARFEVRIERRCEWYLWNVVLVTWALVTMSAVVYAIDPADVADRMAVNVTLVLTVIAFKFTFASEVPKKAYLTWMDKYLVAAFILLVLQSGQITMASRLSSKSSSFFWCEDMFAVVVYGTWTLYHAFLAIFSRWLYPSWERVVHSQGVQTVL